MRRIVLLLVIALAVFWWFRRPISRPAGILITRDPVQVEMVDHELQTTRAGFQISPLANYSIEGRVLHTKRYLADAVSKLAPYDVGLGWRELSDTSNIEQLAFSQSNRFLFWHWTQQPPLAEQIIKTHASNNHIIPATTALAWQVAWLREGELVRFEGTLIEATGEDGRKWSSSLRRDDTGNGACEILWLSRITKL